MFSSSRKTSFCTSWSGGKDACFAFEKMVQHGHQPACLLTMLKEDGEQSSSHGLSREVLAAQAKCLGIPIVFGQAGFGEYEAGLKQALNQAVSEYGADVIAYGDIDLQGHKDWYEKILAGFGVEPCFPIWHYEREQLLEDMFAEGIETMIVSVKKDTLSDDYLGKILTPVLAIKIQQQGICPTGEDGEFHTLVLNAPWFNSKLAIRAGDIFEDKYGHRMLGIMPCEHPVTEHDKPV